jgi:hypothetical protein
VSQGYATSVVEGAVSGKRDSNAAGPTLSDPPHQNRHSCPAEYL